MSGDLEAQDNVLQDTIDKFGRASAFSKSAHQEKAVQAVIYVTQRVQEQRLRSLITYAVRDDDVVLHCYMSDGWTCWANEQSSANMGGGKRTVREVRHRYEWLMEKEIVKTLDYVGRHSVAYLSSLPKLQEGKTGWHVFSASLQALNIRNLKRSGIVQAWFLQDGMHIQHFKKKSTRPGVAFFTEIASWA